VTARWRRLGVLTLDTSRARHWAASHAALPVVEPAGDGIWNLFLSLRDEQGRARIGRTRLVLAPAPALSPLEAEPILELGTLGTFDDSGVVTSCLLSVADRRYLFYTGWSRGVTVPFYLGAGVAVSDGGRPFVRLSQAPMLERTDAEPYLTASPFVILEGGRWRMWYSAGTGWRTAGDRPEPCYHLRYTESQDGITWDRPGRPVVEHDEDEHAFGRPWVVHDDGRYHVWFSARGRRYRIGYASSDDGIGWARADHAAGLEPSDAGWDSEMVEYPCVFAHHGRRYMLYNGNDFGRSGVGIAVWDPAGQNAR
jgi:hypothetical protein